MIIDFLKTWNFIEETNNLYSFYVKDKLLIIDRIDHFYIHLGRNKIGIKLHKNNSVFGYLDDTSYIK